MRNISQYCFRDSSHRLGTNNNKVARAGNQGLQGITIIATAYANLLEAG
ncbi:hypothetical protein IQ259_06765 [Fortiea sp. LEGE XX443]|nr:hypothetical protein [Fortiea sp. LEGE XX443]MBE9004739.1 hypothetical protein [Fortiea sp. LEGE XX443]